MSEQGRPILRAAVLGTALLAVAMAAASCGSGVIGGIFASDRSRSGADTGDARPPRALLDKPAIPLISDWPAELRVFSTLRITNYLVPSESEVRVSLSAPSIGLTRDASRVEAILSSDVASRTTTLVFVIDIGLVIELLGSQNRSVDAQVFVEVDGVDIVPPTVLRFVESGAVIEKRGGALFDDAIQVSVDGTSKFELEAEKLFAKSSESDLVDLVILQRNMQVPGNDAQRRVPALDKDYVFDEQTKRSTIRGVAPTNRYPGIARILLRDPRSGIALDTRNGQKFFALPRLLYVPTLRAVGPGALPAEGGFQARLVGRGLLPAENNGSFRFLFDRISLSIHKGGASTEVQAEAIFEDESSEQVIAFRMPEAPDGLPGAATITLDQRLGPQGNIDYSASLDARSASGLRFVRSDPLLGPYVSDIDADVVDISAGRFRQSNPFGDDCVALRVDSTGFAGLQLLRNQGSGLYRSVGARVIARTRNPGALEVANFDAASPEDVIVIAKGTDGTAQHALMESQTHEGSILQPFSRVDRLAIQTIGSVAASTTGDFDKDGISDLVVLHRESSEAPIEIWTKVSGASARKASFGVRGAGDRSVLHAADLDGDGNLDVAFDENGVSRSIVVLYGDGRGAFPRSERVAWANNSALTALAPSYLTSIRNPRGSEMRRNLVVTAELRTTSARTVAWVGLMERGATSFAAVNAQTQLTVPTSARFDACETLDIDDDGQDEIVCAARNEFVGAPLHSFAFPSGKPTLQSNGATDRDLLVRVTSIRKTSLKIAGKDRQALLVKHLDVDANSRRSVLSVFLVGNGRVLTRMPTLPTANVPLAIVVTDLDGDGNDDDIAWFDKRGLSGMHVAAPGIFEQDPGFDLPLDTSLVLPHTLVAVPRGLGAQLAWLDKGGCVNVLDPVSRKIEKSGDFRRFFGAGRSSVEVSSDSKLMVVDTGPDSIPDLVVFVRSVPIDGVSVSRLVFCRGRLITSAFPFYEARNALALHAQALAPSVGNFTGHDRADTPGIDLAYDSGDSLLFASLDLADDPLDDLFVAHPEITLSAPIGVQAPILVDLDEDGRDDVAALVPNASGVRVWFNRIARVDGKLQGQFVSLGGSTLVYPGNARSLDAVDMNGDGRRDLLVVSQLTDGVNVRPLVTYFSNQDRGALSLAYVYPTRWLGTTPPQAWAAADLDANGMTDLVFGTRILLSR